MVSRTPRLPGWRAVMELAGRQHGVVSRDQLIALGVPARGIKYRVKRGRLHVIFRGAYAVGRPQVTREGRWMAAVLVCGSGSALSHGSGLAHWGIGNEGAEIEVSVLRDVRPAGIRVHRRTAEIETIDHLGIPVTSPTQTLIDVSPRLTEVELQRAINEADKLDRIEWDRFVAAVDASSARGAARLRELLARQMLVLTDSELEDRFAPIAGKVGLGEPLTHQWLDGFPVDFYWPDLGLVVETDGLRYHRTPLTQARDARRDQVHLAAGRTPVRFTHGQIAHAPAEVERTLRAVVKRLLERRAA